MIGKKLLTDISNTLFCNIVEDPVTLASIIIPYGYSSKEYERGYAHLIEHMVIQSNQEYFNMLESNGIIYNAETQAEQINFTFIDFNSDTLLHETEHLGDILKTEFTQKALDIEIKTIYQEHLYRSSTFSLDSVNTALGTVEEINNFDLEKLKKARDIALQKYKLLFINPEPKRLGKELKKAPVYRINDNWYKNIVITHFENNGNSINIRLKKDIYAELFVYALRILSMCSFDAYEIEHLRSENFIDIKLPFGKEEFLKMIKDKDKIFSRYILYLSTMKVYHQELAYCVNNIGVDFETHKCFMNEWEEKVIENF